MSKQTVKLNYLRIAPRKVRLIAATLKGLPVTEAEAQLMLRPQRAAKPLLKLLRSAVSAAKANRKLDAEKLLVENVRVDQGPMLKRVLPRARGMATPIQKKMSHVTLILAESSSPLPKRFTIVPPKKTKLPPEVKPAKKKPAKPPESGEKEVGKPKKAGFFQRVFRRKAV
jgi:large subunit ribosomal protein L22